MPIQIRGPPPKPARASDAMPSSTRACVVRRVSATKRAGSSVSRLTVTRCRPAAFNDAACSASRTPLVVIARSRRPGLAASGWISAGRSRRSNGSPPVSRTLSTPSAMNTSTSRLISSNCNISSRGSQTYSSSGMQYAQRRLQRSVTETLKLRRNRPWVSRSGITRFPPAPPHRPARAPTRGSVRPSSRRPQSGPTASARRSSARAW